MKLIFDNGLTINNLKISKSFFQKLRGKFLIKEALLLTNCNSIHTIFMNKKIDAIFLDKNNKIIKIFENLPPRCIIFPIANTKNIIEFDAGFIKNAKIELGQIVILEE